MKVNYISMKIFWLFAICTISPKAGVEENCPFTEKISDVIPRGIFVLC